MLSSLGHKKSNSGAHSRNVSGASSTGVNLAQQYEEDKNRIIQSCFLKKDVITGKPVENYITHVRIFEEHYPPNGKVSYNKERLIIAAVRVNGDVVIHKARQNSDRLVQIGKTWGLRDLSKVARDTTTEAGFTVVIGKPYYWMPNTARERQAFIQSLLRIYYQFTHGKLPIVEGFDSAVMPVSATGTPPSPAAPQFSSPQKPSSSTQPQDTTSSQQAQKGQHKKHPSLSRLNIAGITRGHDGSKSPSTPKSPLSNSKTASRSSFDGAAKGIGSGVANAVSKMVKPSSPKSPTHGGSAMEPPTKAPPLENDDLRTPSNVYPSSQPFPTSTTRPPQPSPSVNENHTISSTPDQERYPGVAANSNRARQGSPLRQQAPILTGASSLPDSQRQHSPLANGEQQQQRLGEPIALRPPQPQHQLIPNRSPEREPPTVYSTPYSEPSGSPPLRSTANVSGAPPGTVSPVTTRQGHKENNRSVSDIMGVSPQPYTTPSSAQNARRVSQMKNGQAMSPNLQENDQYQQQNSIPGQWLGAFPGGFPTSPQPSAVLNSSPPRKREQVPMKMEPPSGPTVAKQIETSKTFPKMSKQNTNNNNEPVSTMNPKQRSSKRFSAVPSVNRLSALSSRPSILRKGGAGASRHNRNESNMSQMSYASAIEETLEEFRWNDNDNAETIEKQIVEDLGLLEAANIHAIVEGDERVQALDSLLENAILECDRLSSSLAVYEAELDTVSDDINFIENQSQGLQVQTANQKVLWADVHDLLDVVSVPREVSQSIEYGKLDKSSDVLPLQTSLLVLYRALRAISPKMNSGVTENKLYSMRALQEKRGSYESLAFDFSNRFKIFYIYRIDSCIQQTIKQGPVQIIDQRPHAQGLALSDLEYLSGILLFVRDIGSTDYPDILAHFSTSASQYYGPCFRDLFSRWKAITKEGDPEIRQGFAIKEEQNETIVKSVRSLTVKRSATLARFKDQTNKERKQQSKKVNADVAAAQILDNLEEVLAKQQDFLISCLHMSSYAANDYEEYVERVRQRSKRGGKSNGVSLRGVDPDRDKAKEMLNLMTEILGSTQDDLLEFYNWISESDPMSTIGIIYETDVRIAKYEYTNLDILVQILRKTRDRLALKWEKFLKTQLRSIEQSSLTSKKRTGVVSFVRIFPVFCNRLSEQVKGLEHEENGRDVRGLVTNSLEQLGSAIFSTLKNVAKESPEGLIDPSEDKEQLNYHVTMIQNMNYLTEELKSSNNSILVSMDQRVMDTFKSELTKYIDLVVRRPLRKLVDFVDGVESLTEAAPNEDPSLRPSYSKSTIRKILAAYDAKEIKRGVEALHKRVEKHFLDHEDPSSITLYQNVWRAIQAEYMRLVNRLSRILTVYYHESGVNIEFNRDTVTTAFAKRMQVT